MAEASATEAGVTVALGAADMRGFATRAAEDVLAAGARAWVVRDAGGLLLEPAMATVSST
ncbi:MAG: hypothetical protein ACK4TG_06850 [Thermaurantiacus sp.]